MFAQLCPRALAPSRIPVVISVLTSIPCPRFPTSASPCPHLGPVSSSLFSQVQPVLSSPRPRLSPVLTSVSLPPCPQLRQQGQCKALRALVLESPVCGPTLRVWQCSVDSESKGTVAVRKVSGWGRGGRFDFFPERQLGALGADKELPTCAPWQNRAAGKEAGTHRAGRATVAGMEVASLSPVI